MRDRRTQVASIVAAVDGVADTGEKDRVGHRRIVPLLGEVVPLHSEWAVGADRRFVAPASCRNLPIVARNAVYRNRHPLRGSVDDDEDIGRRGSHTEEKAKTRGHEPERQSRNTHGLDLALDRSNESAATFFVPHQSPDTVTTFVRTRGRRRWGIRGGSRGRGASLTKAGIGQRWRSLPPSGPRSSPARHDGRRAVAEGSVRLIRKPGMAPEPAREVPTRGSCNPPMALMVRRSAARQPHRDTMSRKEPPAEGRP